MSGLGDTIELQLLEALFHNESFTGPEKVWIALFNTAVNDDGSGVEVSGDTYNRVELDANTTNFSGPVPLAADGHAVENGVIVDFGAAGDVGWGQIVAVAAMDDDVAGNVLMHGLLVDSKEVGAHDPVLFPVGTLRFILR